MSARTYFNGSVFLSTGSLHLNSNVVLSSPDNTRLTLNADVIPSTTVLNLGSYSNPWKSIYVSTGSVFIGATGTLQINNNGVIASPLGFASPTVAIGSTNPGSGITLYSNENKLYYLNQSGASGPVSIFSQAANNINNAYIATGYVGIGNSSPSYPLDVHGSIQTSDQLVFSSSVSSQTGYIEFVKSGNTGLFTNMPRESTGSYALYYNHTTQEIVYGPNQFAEIKYLQAYETTIQTVGTSWTGIKFSNCPLNQGWSTGASVISATFTTSAVYNVTVTFIVHNNDGTPHTFASYMNLDGVPVQGSMKSTDIVSNGTEYNFVNNCLVSVPTGTHSVEVLMASTSTNKVTVQPSTNITPPGSSGSGVSLTIVKAA